MAFDITLKAQTNFDIDFGALLLKTWNGIAIANIKTINGIAIADISNWNDII